MTGLALCLSGYAAASGRRPRSTVLWSAGVVAVVALLAVWGRDWVESHPTRVALSGGILGLLAATVTLPRDGPSRERVFGRSVLLLILLFAFGLRWGELNGYLDRPLDPDARTYLSVARSLGNPFATGIREPLTIWLVRISLIVFGDSVTSLRVASVFFSMLAVASCYLLARISFGWRVGCAAGALLAWWPDSRFFCVRGLRDELVAATVWLFLSALFSRNRSSRPATDAAPLALAAAGLWLTSLTALSTSLVLLGLGLMTRKLRLRAAVIAVIFGLTLVAPFAWSNWKLHGDPLYSVNILARGFANYESAGKPGFPSQEEVRRDRFAGPRMTMAEYVFGQHSFSRIVARTVRGYARLLNGHFRGLTTIQGRESWLLQTLWVVGGALALLTAPGRSLIFTILFWLGPIAFLGGANEFDLDPRLTSPIWALQASLIGLAAIVLGRGKSFRSWGRGWSQTAGGGEAERFEPEAASGRSGR